MDKPNISIDERLKRLEMALAGIITADTRLAHGSTREGSDALADIVYDNMLYAEYYGYKTRPTQEQMDVVKKAMDIKGMLDNLFNDLENSIKDKE